MSKILDWIKKHKGRTVLIVLLVFFLPLIAIIYINSVLSPSFFSSIGISTDSVIAYVAGFEAFLGSVTLGSVAVWQNLKVSELASTANDISAQVLKIEKERRKQERIPYLTFSKLKFPSYVLQECKDNTYSGTTISEQDFGDFEKSTQEEPCFAKIELGIVNVSKLYALVVFYEFFIRTATSAIDLHAEKISLNPALLTPDEKIPFCVNVPINLLHKYNSLKGCISIDVTNHLSETYRQFLFFNIRSGIGNKIAIYPDIIKITPFENYD